MAKPILCFDLDGPLVNERGEIHSRDVAVLRQADPPVTFIPGTGRLLPAVRKLFSRHGVFPDAPLPFSATAPAALISNAFDAPLPLVVMLA